MPFVKSKPTSAAAVAAPATAATAADIRVRLISLTALQTATRENVRALTQRLISGDDPSVDADFNAARESLSIINAKIEAVEQLLEDAEVVEKESQRKAALAASKELRRRVPATLKDISAKEGAEFDELADKLVDCVSRLMRRLPDVKQDAMAAATVLASGTQRSDLVQMLLPDLHGDSAAFAVAGLISRLANVVPRGPFDAMVSFNPFTFTPGITMQQAIAESAGRVAKRLTPAPEGQVVERTRGENLHAPGRIHTVQELAAPMVKEQP